MTDNPNENYYQASLGSLTGFDKVNLVDGASLFPQTGWSIETIRQFLANDKGLNFASPEIVQLINEAIQEHIQDKDNPHAVTLQQITPDFVAGVLENLTTGTVPDAPPFVSYDSALPIPIGEIYPATFSTVNAYRLNEVGYFIDPISEEVVSGVSLDSGRMGLPLFGPIDNVVPVNWATLPSSAYNTTITERSSDDLVYPFKFYSVSEQAGSHASGVSIPSGYANNTVATATFLILATNVGGQLVIAQRGDTTNWMTVDLTTGDCECNTTDIIGATEVYQNEVIRVSFSFKVSSGGQGIVDILHAMTEDRVVVRDGVPGQMIFHIGNPLMTKAPVGHLMPIIKTNTATTNLFVLDTTRVKIPPVMQNLMVAVSLNMYPQLPEAIIPDPVIVNLGNLKIIRDATNIKVTLSGIELFRSPILEGLNNIAISYSPTQIAFKDMATPKRTINGAYPALHVDGMAFGRFGGYVRNVSLYAQSDKLQCLEFLTNG